MRTSAPMNITVPIEIRDTLRAIATRHHLPLSQITADCLREGLLVRGVSLPEHNWAADTVASE
jgi:hypothetical protein